MDHQNNLRRLRIDISDLLMDNGADDTLLQPCISRGGGPDSLEVRSERGERCRIGDGSDLGGIMGGDLVSDLRQARQRLVPARLQPATSRLAGSAASYCRK